MHCRSGGKSLGFCVTGDLPFIRVPVCLCLLESGGNGISHKVGYQFSRGLFLSKYNCRRRCEDSVLYMAYFVLSA